MEDNKPMFVRVDDYQTVLDTLTKLKDKLDDAKDLLAKISDLKDQEDAEIEAWGVGIDDIEKKLAHVDKMLFEPHA